MGCHRIRPPRDARGLVSVLPNAGAGLEMIELAILRLRRGESHREGSADKELAAVLLSGSAEVRGAGFLGELPRRVSVFDGPGSCAFAPAGERLEIRASEESVLAIARAPAAGAARGFIVRPEEVKVSVRGVPPFQREIRDMIDGSRPASRLVLGETITPSGQWSSYPPHRHERDEPPHEAAMEEAYLFRVDPPQGFGMIRLYTDDRSLDEAYAVEDGDVVALPRGYHPVSAAPGYRVYYLWILAGRMSRELRPRDDPAHAWVKGQR